jgi:hypothetical protein
LDANLVLYPVGANFWEMPHYMFFDLLAEAVLNFTIADVVLSWISPRRIN